MPSNPEIRTEHLDANIITSIAAVVGIFSALVAGDLVTGASLAILSALLCFVYRLVLAVEHLAYGS
ncbi:hypothetical protein [Natronorubrum sp. DTA7]|uniref:hypothetical protein n=1 Tax=Natronorubrum sp. DTA7 TaxID=3447016 RepID=UPI003F86862B